MGLESRKEIFSKTFIYSVQRDGDDSDKIVRRESPIIVYSEYLKEERIS